jgi:hypothetical protein
VQSDESSDDSALLIRDILIHVIKHPEAKDTAEGIHKFWLSAQTAHQSRDKVREALKYLSEQKHWLTQKNAGAAVTLYGLDKDHIDEIKEFLRAR